MQIVILSKHWIKDKFINYSDRLKITGIKFSVLFEMLDKIDLPNQTFIPHLF